MSLVAGCGDDPGADPAAKSSAAPTTTSKPSKPAKAAKAYTVEQLGAVLGCKPTFQGKTKGFRQAACTVKGDSFTLLDFETADGQRDWLEYATLYGGIYLAGERWLLSGKSREYLEELQTSLGGTIEESGNGS
jgi:hypothetical protein